MAEKDLLAFKLQFLNFRNRLARVQPFRAHLGAIHNRVTPVQLERVVDLNQPVFFPRVARVDDPSIRLQQHRRA